MTHWGFSLPGIVFRVFFSNKILRLFLITINFLCKEQSGVILAAFLSLSLLWVRSHSAVSGIHNGYSALSLFFNKVTCDILEAQVSSQYPAHYQILVLQGVSCLTARPAKLEDISVTRWYSICTYLIDHPLAPKLSRWNVQKTSLRVADRELFCKS